MQLGRAVGDAFSMALAVVEPIGSSPDWEKLLEVWGVPAISMDERERMRRATHVSHGAPSDEMYAVLTRISQWANAQLPSAYDCNGPDERRYQNLRTRISDLHRVWHQRYKAQVMPAPPSMFTHAISHAMESASSQQSTTHKRTIILRCQNCGGPRLTESKLECEFCGYHLGESGPRRQW